MTFLKSTECISKILCPNFLWLTEQNVIIKDMTDLVKVLKVGQLKVTTNKMSIIARGNAMEDISINLCIRTKKTLECRWLDIIKLNLEN